MLTLLKFIHRSSATLGRLRRWACAGLVVLMACPEHALAAQEDVFDDTLLRSYHLTFQQANWWNQLTSNFPGDTYIPADLEVDGVTYPDVGVRLRGNATYLCATGQKKPFRIQMDAFVSGQELYGVDALRLNNAAMDPSFLREAVMSKVVGEYVPVARRAFSTLEINGESWGVYILEQQKDATWADEWFGSKAGARFKPKSPNTLQWLGPDIPQYLSRYPLVNSPAGDPYSDLVRFFDVLSHTPLASLPNELDQVFDVDSALWSFAANNLFGNADSYQGNSHNYYVIADALEGRLDYQLHDLDLSFGTFLYLSTSYPINGGFTSYARRLSYRLWKNLDTREEYLHHLMVLVEDEFSWAKLAPLIMRYHNMIDAEVLADPKRIFSYNKFQKNLTMDVHGGPCNGDFPGLKRWVDERRAFVLAHPLIDRARPALEVRHHPTRPLAGEPVTVTAQVQGSTQPAWVELRYRKQAGFQTIRMFDDGAHGDGAAGDGLFGTVFSAGQPGNRTEYVVVAAAADGAVAFFPRKSEQHPFAYTVGFGPSGMRITELLYSGADGEFVELTNTTAAPIDLTGWSLDDESGESGTIDLSSVGVLLPGQSIVLTESSAAAFAAAWSIPANKIIGGNALANLGRNDAVHLFDPTGKLADRLTYGDEDFPGSVRAKEESAWVCNDGLGRDDVYRLNAASTADAQGSWTSSGGDLGSPGLHASAECPGLGDSTCAAVPNSTGVAASTQVTGSAVLGHNDLHFQISQLPPGSLGFLLVSQQAGQVPNFAGGQGLLCLGNPLRGWRGELFLADPGGIAQLSPNLFSLPQSLEFLPGETWYFQPWFRDANPSPTSNTADALALTFH